MTRETSTLLEFGEPTADGRTVKAELSFPLEPPLDPAAPFDRVSAGNPDGTTCGTCHPHEMPTVDGRFASDPFRPTDDSLVSVETLRAERFRCDPALEPERCAMLSGLFDHGPVTHASFPDTYRTIFDP